MTTEELNNFLFYLDKCFSILDKHEFSLDTTRGKKFFKYVASLITTDLDNLDYTEECIRKDNTLSADMKAYYWQNINNIRNILRNYQKALDSYEILGNELPYYISYSMSDLKEEYNTLSDSLYNEFPTSMLCLVLFVTACIQHSPKNHELIPMLLLVASGVFAGTVVGENARFIISIKSLKRYMKKYNDSVEARSLELKRVSNMKIRENSKNKI